MNTPFEIAFPGYVQATGDLYRGLLPWGIPILMIGFLSELWHGVPSPAELVKVVIRVFLVLALLANSHTLVNEAQLAVSAWMERTIKARPENIAQLFKQKLAEVRDSRETRDESFLDRIINTDSIFESIIFSILTLISWLAMAVMAFVYSFQRAILLSCWAISPLLIPLLAVRPLSAIGMRHLLRLIGIILWPVGLALAATFSEGLIDVIAKGSTFADVSAGEAVGRGITALLGLVVLAVWLVFSSVLAPILVQRLFIGTDGPGTMLLSGGQLLSQLPSMLLSSGAIGSGWDRSVSLLRSLSFRAGPVGQNSRPDVATAQLSPKPMRTAAESGATSPGVERSGDALEREARQVADRARGI